MLQQVFEEVLSFGLDTCPHSPVCHLLVALLLTHCSKSAHKSGVSSRYCCYGNHEAGSYLINVKTQFIDMFTAKVHNKNNKYQNWDFSCSAHYL